MIDVVNTNTSKLLADNVRTFFFFSIKDNVRTWMVPSEERYKYTSTSQARISFSSRKMRT